MHLVGLVVAGERVHHEIDPGAKGHFALHFASGHGGIERTVAVIWRWGRSERPAAEAKRLIALLGTFEAWRWHGARCTKS